MSEQADTPSGIARLLVSRLKAYLAFAAILAASAFVGGEIAIGLSGSEGYAGFGVFIAMPVAQLLYAWMVMRMDTALGLLLAAPPSVASYYAALELVGVLRLNIESDWVGMAKFLAIYGLVSLVYWEAVRGLKHAWRVRAAAKGEGR